MAFKKSFLIVSLILTFLNIQSSFAMEADQGNGDHEKGWSIRKLLAVGYKTLRDMTDSIDKIHDGDTPSTLTIQPSTMTFFEDCSDDLALYIVFQLCTMEQAIEELRSVALTCRKGYQLTQSPQLWAPLKKTYFRHLPEEYMEVLTKDKTEQGFPLAGTLLRQLCSYQSEEIAQLKRILSPGYHAPVMHGDARLDDVPTLIYEPSRSFKKKYLAKLENKENLKSYSKFYFSQEEMLDSINSEVITECLKFIKISEREENIEGITTRYKFAAINLKGALTRLPSEGLDALIENWFLGKIDYVNLNLSCNSLRVLPDELFSSRISELDLRNNFLAYIPCSIVYAEKNLEKLYLGNFKPLGNTCSCCDYIGRRTTGNFFESIPPVILTLVNLKTLELGSVGLKTFSEEETYRSLPKLSIIYLRHNELKVVPQTEFKDRIISVNALGNPCHKRTILDPSIWNYRYSTYCSAPITRGINHCMRHKFIPIAALGLGYLLNSYFEIITFHDNVLTIKLPSKLSPLGMNQGG